jgi:DNA-binding NtrC family response regulator
MAGVHKVLLVDDDENVISALKRVLRGEGYILLESHNAEEALKVMEHEPVDLVICDYRLPGMNGIDFFEMITQKGFDTVNIILTGKPDLTMAMDAINRAVLYKVLLKPWDNDILRVMLRRALEQRATVRENKRLLTELKKRDDVAKSLEADTPGITRLTKDQSGFIVVDGGRSDA